MTGIITNKNAEVEDLFAAALGVETEPMSLTSGGPAEHTAPTSPSPARDIAPPRLRAPERITLPAYDGPRLEPTRTISGWCMQTTPLEAHTRCKVWFFSPGTRKEAKYNDQIPCTCECHREYLDDVFGTGWERSTGKRFGPSLRDVLLSSNVTDGLPKPGSVPNMEVEVSDTQHEEVAVAEPTEDFEYDKPEGVASVAVEVPAEEAVADARTDTEREADEQAEAARAEAASTEPVAEAVAEDKPKRERAARTDLEPEVKAVTDDFVTGKITLAEGESLTPHRIAKEVQQRRGAEKAPSTGAVSAVLDRWEGIGFATLSPKPKAFGDYTDAGREKGLSALKAEASAARKAAKAEAKASA